MPKPESLSQKNLQDLSVTSTSLGTMIPIIRGTFPVPGNIVDATQKIPHEVDASSGESSGGGKGGFGGSAPAQMTTTYSVSLFIILCKGPIVRISKVWNDLTLVFDETQGSSKYSVTTYSDTGAKPGLRTSDNCTEMHVFLGTEDQAAMEFFQDVHGPANVQAYRGCAAVGIKNLDIGTSGRVPQFRFEVIEKENRMLKESIVELCEMVGLSESFLDLTNLTDAPVSFIVNNVVSAATVIENLMNAYNFMIVESDGKVKFKDKVGESLTTIPERLLSAGIDTQSKQSLPVTRIQNRELPTKVTVTYPEAERHYQDGTQTQQLINSTFDTDAPLAINVPIAITAEQAKNLTETILYEAWASREHFTFTLPPRYMVLEAGDLVSATARGLTRTMRITEWTNGDNWVSEVKGMSNSSSVFGNFHSIPVVGTIGPTPIPNPAATIAFLIEPPPLSSAEIQARYLFAAFSLEVDKTFAGSNLYESNDSGASYNYVISSPSPARVGLVTAALSAPFNFCVWDDVNTIDVVIFQGTLESVSELDVLNGINWAYLGGEIIGFQYAALVSERTYHLSHLLRGRKGTESYLNTHTTDEFFVLLSRALRTRERITYPITRLNIVHDYKVLDATLNISAATPFTYAPNGTSIKPWAPVVKTVQHNTPAAGDITFSWLARSRLNDSPIGVATTWDIDSPQSFVIVIYADGTYTIQRRVIETGVLSVPADTLLSQVYTAAQQTADFGGTLSTVYYSIYATGVGVNGYSTLSSG